jgi:hypothetical protein
VKRKKKIPHEAAKEQRFTEHFEPYAPLRVPSRSLLGARKRERRFHEENEPRVRKEALTLSAATKYFLIKKIAITYEENRLFILWALGQSSLLQSTLCSGFPATIY